MAKLKLKAITDGKDKNRYCGPSVISALTDLTTGEAARLIRKQNGRSAIRGSYTHEVLDALRACNIKALSWRRPGVRLSRSTGPTLAGWLKMSKEDRTPGRVFLIAAGHHWQLVSGRRYTCGRIRDIVSIKNKRVKRRARVSEVYELMSDNVTKPDIEVTKPKDPRQSARSKASYGVRKILRQYPEFGYEKDDVGYYVTMSEQLEEQASTLEHPLSDAHYCDDIFDVHYRMLEMVEFAKENAPSSN
jgi:hypothetical protein